jgi:protein-disulfide isomerase
MQRIVLGLVVVVCLLSGALGYSVLGPRPATDTAVVRAIVEQVLAEQPVPEPLPALPASVIAETDVPAVATLDPAQLQPLIEDYLMSNPAILERMSSALQTQQEAEAREKARVAIADIKDQLFDDPQQVVLGNPDGDVTLVQMFDYNCTYCRANLPDLASLLSDDPNLRLVLKEFPILAQGSVDAARVGVVVNQSDKNYWDYHKALFTSRGQIDKEAALVAATSLGLDRAQVEEQMASEDVSKVLNTSFMIADRLGITGTPTFILGDEVIVGQASLEELRGLIANMRACGKTACPA